MKLFVASILLAIGISALPQQLATHNKIADHVINIIVEISEKIRDLGLDPVNIDERSGSYALPVPTIFSAAGSVEDLVFEGLSNIIINQLTYDPASSLVTFNLAMPQIHGAVGNANGEVVVLSNKIVGDAAGSLTFSGLSVSGFVSVTVGGSGVIANNAFVQASIANIQSNLAVNIATPSREFELGPYLNQFFNVLLPERLDLFQSQVEELIAIYLVRFINRNN